MNPPEYQQLNELIGTVMADDIPADVERRLCSQLTDFRSRLGEVDETTVAPSATWKRSVWSRVAATVAVALILTAVTGWYLWPRVSFADVAPAVLKQPWIHVTIAEPNGQTSEIWYSPKKDISASRRGDRIEYRDHRLKVYYSYDATEKVLYRVPEFTRRRANQLAAMTAVLPLMLQNEQLVEKPLERMEFLGDARSDMKLIDQKLRKVDDGGRQWLEFDLTIRYRGEPDPIHMLFRVDPKTKLPRLCRFEGRWKGKQMVREQRFEYPETGPVDVYDLGVPKTARLVDRIPSDDIERILKNIRAGRQRMDNYRAIVVEQRRISLILYRKGDNFRADFPYSPGKLRKVDEPAKDENMDAWWRRRANDFLYYPIYIVRGGKSIEPSAVVGTTFSFKGRFVTDDDGSKHVEIESVKKWNVQSRPGEISPPYYSRRPEFICRPPLGIPSEMMEPVLDLNPTFGPNNSVLLHVRRSGRMPLAAPHAKDKKLPPQPDAFRYWLDPARDYAVVRWDMLGAGDPGQEEFTSSRVIEKMAKSPQGTWYATQVRITSKRPGGKDSVQVVHIYLDFETDLPDALFEPPVVGRVY